MICLLLCYIHTSFYGHICIFYPACLERVGWSVYTYPLKGIEGRRRVGDCAPKPRYAGADVQD